MSSSSPLQFDAQATANDLAHRMPALATATNLNTILQFVVTSTKIFDESHNHEHAIAVLNNAIRIAQIDYPTYKSHEFGQALALTALCHDVCDHKYPMSISHDELEKFIASLATLSDKDQIMTVIQYTSFSKEDSRRKQATANNTLIPQVPGLNPLYLIILRILQDADRIEAIGQTGIERCRAFTKAQKPHLTDTTLNTEVIKHCHDKLLRLYNENFIATNEGRRIALPHHQYILHFVKQNLIH
jgi:hypothetical protein